MKVLFQILGQWAAGVGILLFFGLGIGSTEPMPRNAWIAVNRAEGHYYGPSCLPLSGEAQQELVATATFDDYHETLGKYGLEVVRVEAAYAAGLAPDPTCRDHGAFIQDRRSMTGGLLESAGLLPEQRSRWNDDGTWNW